MTAKADQNPNAGIERVFTGLIPDTDARAFQTHPDAASRPSWRVVSSDGSRSEAGSLHDGSLHDGHSPAAAPSAANSPSATASSEASGEASGLGSTFLEQVLCREGEGHKSRHIDLPHVNADVAELALACGVNPPDPREEGEAVTGSEQADLTPPSEPETYVDRATPDNTDPAPNDESPVAQAFVPRTNVFANGASSVSECHQTPRSDANYELARVVRAWGQLPPNIRSAILAIIDSL